MKGPGGPGPRGMGTPEQPGKLLGRLARYIFKNYSIHIVIVVICIFVSVLANVQGTMFMKTLIDQYITPLLSADTPDFGPLAVAIARVACFYAIGVIATYTYNRIMINVSQGTLRNLRNDMFATMETLPIKYFDTHAHGDIMSIYTNDIDTLRQMISQSFPQLLSSVITIVSVLVSMLILNVPLTVVTLLMVAIMMTASRKLAGLSGKYFLEQQTNLGIVNGYIEEMMEGQKVVKVFCHEDESIRKFDELNDQLFTSADNANRFANILMPVVAQLGNVSYVICAMVGGILAINGFGSFTLGGLASFLTFNKSFNMPINQVSQQFNSIVMALAGAKRIFDLLDEKPEVDEGYVTLVNAKEENGVLTESDKRTGRWAWKHFHKAEGTTDYIELKGDMVLEDVDFGYNSNKIVLHDINMYAQPGQKIAFVGSTGAGKTTITNLLNRFYDIQKGKIRYDGINITKIKKDDLRRSMGIVLQDTNLFTATVMENIRYGKLDATDEEVIAAAKASYDEWGFGLSSVRFICGTQQIHKQLERKIADFLGMDDCILYTSCFDANGGLFETLLGAEDAIISDELNHASIIDGVRLCKAKIYNAEGLKVGVYVICRRFYKRSQLSKNSFDFGLFFNYKLFILVSEFHNCGRFNKQRLPASGLGMNKPGKLLPVFLFNGNNKTPVANRY